MDKRINPFNELYVSETIPPMDFVRVFSPKILKNAEALFLPGNVVIQGVQGSGKSMLLSLLRPEIRIAYKEQGKEIPLRGRLARFIGAGINITRSPAVNFGGRQIDPRSAEQKDALAIYFGDFINNWIVFDLLDTIEKYKSELNGAVALELGMAVDDDHLNSFAVALAGARCWFGYYRPAGSYADLKSRIADRIDTYIKFLNFACNKIPDEIVSTKTSVGEPVAHAAELLRKHRVVPEDMHVFVRIDQYEELSLMEELKLSGLGPVFRSVINSALGHRNPHVSYRIGTRPYAWQAQPRPEIWGTAARLERDRNFKLIDLDEILRRQENPKTWIFPTFAEDVFTRRLTVAGYDVHAHKSPMKLVFEDLPPADRAKTYCGDHFEKSLKPIPEWPEGWKQFLKELARGNPLSARLADAWVRQRGKESLMLSKPAKPFPWEHKEYWKKERIHHALMQIASRCRQRMIWAGPDDIYGLSAGNILVFVSICQHIWSTWLKVADEADVTASDASPPTIRHSIQTVGIHEASNYWMEKILEDNRGTTRQRFVRIVGVELRKKLEGDLSLSHPGYNGFSLTLDDLDKDERVKTFLDSAVDYGALFDWAHTTKEKNRLPRRKWYLNPVLTPYFGIPHIRTKEPLYTTLAEVRGWVEMAENPSDAPEEATRSSSATAPSTTDDQLPLF